MPDDDTLAELRRWNALIKKAQARHAERVEMHVITLDTLRLVFARPSFEPVWLQPITGLPVFTVDDVPVGQVRVRFSDGSSQLLGSPT